MNNGGAAPGAKAGVIVLALALLRPRRAALRGFWASSI
jgi:hypothetical protein